MSTRPRVGFTLIEVLIALAVIGIAFAALGFAQLTNLRASTSSRLVTETKSAANLVLEEVLNEVLKTESGCDRLADAWCDENGVYFAFNDFYWTCPSVAGPTGVDVLQVRDDREASDECSGQRIITVAPDRTVDVQYTIFGESGVLGQGVLSVSVTATHRLGGSPSLTIGDRVTCYDVYPTPTAEAPAPCPIPGPGGGGR
jgi:prepilin-type N-terminal cleavage/methylation domain-containing protein